MVKASGNAKQDQSLYIGTYNKISNYNGHHAYEREGKERLYIYFYSSLVRPRQDFLLYVHHALFMLESSPFRRRLTI